MDARDEAIKAEVAELKQEKWFRGELTTEAASELLQSCNKFCIFIVFHDPSSGDFYLSTKTPCEGLAGGVVEHLVIFKVDDGYYLSQSKGRTVVETVNKFIITKNLLLTPLPE